MGQADQVDVIVVGAGPAGCAAAWDLASAGRSVLLLDRAEFPRHKACAGGLTRKSLLALRYSIAPVTRQTISAIVVEKRRGEAATLSSRSQVCAMTVRRELDEFCLRQTIAAGARFQRIGPIEALESASGSVTLRTAGGTFSASFLVAADGVHSRIRQLLCGDRPPWFRRGFAIEADVRLPGGQSSDLVFDFAPVRQGYGWIFPKGDHLNCGLYSEAPEKKLNRESLSAWIQARFSGAQVDHLTGQYLGFGAESALPDSSRVFLIGDAGGFADPLTGEGIYGAIASGQAAAAAIQRELTAGEPAQLAFPRLTAQLRQDLGFSASEARWFYGNLDLGFRALAAPIFRGAVINAYANGTRIAALANAIRRFARLFPASA